MDTDAEIIPGPMYLYSHSTDVLGSDPCRSVGGVYVLRGWWWEGRVGGGLAHPHLTLCIFSFLYSVCACSS